MTRAARIVGSSYERFVAKVAIDRDTGCWNWTAATTNGYGVMNSTTTPRALAHRFSYEHHVGAIPSGYEIHHTCENRLCVNPAHLGCVTRLEHARLGHEARKTHCKRGHELVADNLLHGTRWRHCKTCHRERAYAKRHGYVFV